MRVINRTAITIDGAQLYITWTLQKEADFNKGTLTVARAKTYGSAFLLPEFELEGDVQVKTFRDWFRIDVHGVVVDVADDDIEGVEL